MIVDTAQLGVFQRPMADLLVSEVARNNFNAGLDQRRQAAASKDRKSTRLNSSH